MFLVFYYCHICFDILRLTTFQFLLVVYITKILKKFDFYLWFTSKQTHYKKTYRKNCRDGIRHRVKKTYLWLLKNKHYVSGKIDYLLIYTIHINILMYNNFFQGGGSLPLTRTSLLATPSPRGMKCFAYSFFP